MVAIEGATGVTFEGITFEVTRGTGFYIEGGSKNTIRGCTLRNTGIIAVQIGKGIKPFPYGKHDGCGNKADGKPGEQVSRKMGSWHEHIYKYTAWSRGAGTATAQRTASRVRTRGPFPHFKASLAFWSRPAPGAGGVP